MSAKAKSLSAYPQQVIVILKEGSGTEISSLSTRRVDSASPMAGLKKTLSAHGVELVPVFGESEIDVASFVAKAERLAPSAHLSWMNRFYTVPTAAITNPEKLVSDLEKLDIVDGAYLKPLGKPPVYDEGEKFPGSLAATNSSVPITSDLTNNQSYLNAAPPGVDARYAWGLPGGRGDGVNIIDIEGGWNFGHEDLQVNSGGLIKGFNHTSDPNWYQHGTAVLGEMGGDRNTLGVTGICPNAHLRAISVFTNSQLAYNSAGAIRAAADALRAGDLILIEQHRPGPNYPGGNTQMGFIAIEWWPDDFLAIQYATSKGVIVVEAAGNGSQNLNDAVYNTPQAGFPSWWRNPFNRPSGMDCGAVVVGAGAPPPGTNGGNWGVDRSRLSFSNFGTCVDAQGWGNGVTSTGYGDVHGTNATNRNEWYTNFFSGTSSASPIVTGTIACLQGIQRAAGRPILTPSRVRDLLRTTGSPQQAGTGTPNTQRIGNRPNLRQLIQAVAGAPHWCGVQFTGQVPAGQTSTWFTHSWPDVWQVLWTVVPTAPIQDGNAQIEFKIQADRQAFGLLKYFIQVKNLIAQPVTVEARFCVLAS
jgi:hypothetical protein